MELLNLIQIDLQFNLQSLKIMYYEKNNISLNVNVCSTIRCVCNDM